MKHALTKVIFAKLYLDMRDVTLVSGHDLGEGLGDLIEAEERTRTLYRRSDTLEGWEGTWDPQGRNNSSPFDAEGAALNDLTGTNLLAWTLVGHGSSRAALVEILTAYSHSTQAADLRLCRTAALTSPARGPRPSAKRPWSLRERLDEREIAELITEYREGATAASLATVHGVSLRSVKRLLRTAGVRRTSPPRQATKATPAATHP